MKGTFLFLGSGASSGVPLIGCKCAVCTSKDLRNNRLRPSGLIRLGGKVILIDIGPDFRQQALRSNISHLDGLLLTHTHYDHIAGLDDIRILNERGKKPLPCLLSRESLDELKIRVGYMFKNREGGANTASIDCQIIPAEEGSIDFLGIQIQYTSFTQAGMKVNGFRIGNLAYISDIREYSDEIFQFLKGVDHLVLSALRSEPSAVHLSLDEAVSFASKTGAPHTWLTHLSHKIDHEITAGSLPSNVQPAYDGLELDFGV